jgi:hypothetical protein
MTQEEIQEGNRLIAEFIGRKLNGISLNEYRKIPREDRHLFNGAFLEDLQYYTSWDWLMPVVEKIESGEYAIIHTTYFGKNHVYIRAEHERKFKHIDFWWGEAESDNKCETKLEATYKAVVEFIKWYNKNKEG